MEELKKIFDEKGKLRIDVCMKGVPEGEIAHAEKFTDQIQHQTVHAVTRF